MVSNRNIKEVFQDDEVSLIELFNIFWKRKNIVFYGAVLGLVIGLAAFYTTPKEYTSKAKLLTEESNNGNDQRALAGLAGLAGINIDDAISDPLPQYGVIAESQPFLLGLIKEKVYSEESRKKVDLQTYLTDPDRQSLLRTILRRVVSLPKRLFSTGNTTVPKHSTSETSDIKLLTGQELSAMAELLKRIKIINEGRFVTIEVKMPEPLMSAEMNELVKEKLISYVTNFKTIRRQRNLKFLESRTAEAKRNFEKAQMSLAGFQDRNLGLIVQTGRAKETQLQAQYNLYFSLYSSLSSQLEQAKIKLKEETPVFSDFEPVSIPLSHSEPAGMKYIFLFTLGGIFIGGLLVIIFLVKEFFTTS